MSLFNGAGQGTLKITGGRLSQLGTALGSRGPLDSLRGRVDLTLTYGSSGQKGGLDGQGTIRISRLQWADNVISDSIRARIRIANGEIHIEEASGIIGDGELTIRLIWNINDPDRSRFKLSLVHADTVRVLAPLGFGNAENGPIQGSVDALLQGRLGREWRGEGQLVFRRSKFFGAEVGEWRMPVEFGYNPNFGSGFLNVRDSVAQLGQGRAVGNAMFRLNDRLRLEGGFRFTNADLKAILPPSDAAHVPDGRMSGRLDFNSDNLPRG